MFCFRTIGLGYFGLTQKQVSLCTYYIIFLNLESVECWNEFFFSISGFDFMSVSVCKDLVWTVDLEVPHIKVEKICTLFEHYIW